MTKRNNSKESRKRKAEIQVTSSDNAQDPPDITANNQKQENEAPEIKKEANKQSLLKSEEDGDVMNYDDLDNWEYPEFTVPNDDEPPNQLKKRHPELSHGNPKRLKIERQEEPDLVNTPNIDEAEIAPVEDQSIDNNDQKRVKIEDFLEEIEQPIEEWIPDEKPEMPPPTISLLKLAEQIEILAFNINLEDFFQEKALRAVRLFKADDQAIPIQDFNQLFNVFLTSLKRERAQNSNENSIQLSRLFKHLQRTLIRPLGADLMAEALRMLDDEIQKLEGNEEKVF
ncbi:unnamed protein product [Caenorhabditis nigoni]